MRGRIAGLVSALTIGMVSVAGAASAQIAGEWTFPFGETRLEVDNRTNINGLAGPAIWTTIDINSASSIRFYGTVRNLVWEGRWYFFGGRPPSGAAFEPCARPHSDRNQRETLIYGSYRVTFNAAENRFEGVMSRCRAPVGQAGYSQPLVGTRNNTFTAYGGPEPDRGARDVPALPSGLPSPPPIPTPEQDAARALSAADRQCVALRDGLRGVSWSPGFETHPCIYNIGDEIEIITRTDQTQRPVSVIYRAFHAGRSGTPSYLRLESRRGLANQGVPRAGHRYRVSFGGDICRESTWMLSILMSDGTETPPIGMIQTGTERVPLFRRGCNPGSHTHALEDYRETDPAARGLTPVPRG